MTDLTHDPEFPYVFRFSSGDKPSAKFRNKMDANAYAENYVYGSVIDTTPTPVIEVMTVAFLESHVPFIKTKTGWKYHNEIDHVGDVKLADDPEAFIIRQVRAGKAKLILRGEEVTL